MEVEENVWVMHGREWNDPDRIKSLEELIEYIDDIGFLPLFRNGIAGFSVEESASDKYWWTGDCEQDPWMWRMLLARGERVAYGKFFGMKAGFISMKWLPYFVNYRRDGYDFDSRYEDGLVEQRRKRVMDLFDTHTDMYSYEIKKQAGFGKDGAKNFSGVMTELQMQLYLVARDFRYRQNKKGEDYGMQVAVYAKPESIWGHEFITSQYKEKPSISGERIINHVKGLYPAADDKKILKLLK